MAAEESLFSAPVDEETLRRRLGWAGADLWAVGRNDLIIIHFHHSLEAQEGDSGDF